MVTRLTAAEYRSIRGGRRRSKYNNRRTRHVSLLCGERTYDSAFEARHAEYLDALVRAGELRAWVPQVSIPVPGLEKTRMVIDFMLVHHDGRVTWQDTKGAEPTRDWKLKAELVRKYGIEVEIVKSTRRPR